MSLLFGEPARVSPVIHDPLQTLKHDVLTVDELYQQNMQQIFKKQKVLEPAVSEAEKFSELNYVIYQDVYTRGKEEFDRIKIKNEESIRSFKGDAEQIKLLASKMKELKQNQFFIPSSDEDALITCSVNRSNDGSIELVVGDEMTRMTEEEALSRIYSELQTAIEDIVGDVTYSGTPTYGAPNILDQANALMALMGVLYAHIIHNDVIRSVRNRNGSAICSNIIIPLALCMAVKVCHLTQIPIFVFDALARLAEISASVFGASERVSLFLIAGLLYLDVSFGSKIIPYIIQRAMRAPPQRGPRRVHDTQQQNDTRSPSPPPQRRGTYRSPSPPPRRRDLSPPPSRNAHPAIRPGMAIVPSGGGGSPGGGGGRGGGREGVQGGRGGGRGGAGGGSRQLFSASSNQFERLHAHLAPGDELRRGTQLERINTNGEPELYVSTSGEIFTTRVSRSPRMNRVTITKNRRNEN